MRVLYFENSQPQCVNLPDQYLIGEDSNNNSFSAINHNYAGGELLMVNDEDNLGDHRMIDGQMR